MEATSRPAGLRRALRALTPGGVYATDATLRLGISHSRAVLPDLLDFVDPRRTRHHPPRAVGRRPGAPSPRR